MIPLSTTPLTLAFQLDIFFTAIFTVELIFNLLAHWFIPFVTSGWSPLPYNFQFVLHLFIAAN